MATRRRIQLELPRLDSSERDFRAALNDRMRRIQSMFDELDFPPAIASVINQITQGTGLCVIQEIPEGTVDGTNRTFYTTHEPSPALIWVQVNGFAMNPFADYDLTAEEGKIEFTEGVQPKEGEDIWVWYFCGDLLPPRVEQSVIARLFSGGSNAINYGYSADYLLLGDMSMGLWAKFASTTVSGGILMQYGQRGAAVAGNHPYLLMVVGSSANWNIQYFHEYDLSEVTDTPESHTFSTGIGDNAWHYIGISRDDSAKTVDLYIGPLGGSVSHAGTFTYTNSPAGGTSTASRLQVGNQPGGGAPFGNVPLSGGTIQEHYLWDGVVLSSGDHQSAMDGEPPSSGLILSVPVLGNEPEIDVVGGATGAVTGTTEVPGHN